VSRIRRQMDETDSSYDRRKALQSVWQLKLVMLVKSGTTLETK